MTKRIDNRLLEPEGGSYKKPTELEEWERYGCHNNEEWHEHLNRLMWAECTPNLR